MADKLTERELESLFQKYMPSDEIPPGLADRVQQRVLAEVAVTLRAKDQSTAAQPQSWWSRLLDRIPQLRMGPSLALASATVAVLIFLLQFGDDINSQIRGLLDDPQTASSPGEVAQITPDLTDEEGTDEVVTEPISTTVATPTPADGGGVVVDPTPGAETPNEGQNPDAGATDAGLPNPPVEATSGAANPIGVVDEPGPGTDTPTPVEEGDDEEPDGDATPTPTVTDEEEDPDEIPNTPLANATPTYTAPTAPAGATATATVANLSTTATATPAPADTETPTDTPIRTVVTEPTPTQAQTETATPVGQNRTPVPVTPTPTVEQSGAGSTPTATPTRTPLRQPTHTPTRVVVTAQPSEEPNVAPAPNTATATATPALVPPTDTVAQPTATPTSSPTAVPPTATPKPTATPTLSPTPTTPPLLPPQAVEDVVPMQEDVPRSVNVLANDNNVAGAVATILQGPTNGSLTEQGNGVYLYSPKPNFHGEDIAFYQVSANGLSTENIIRFQVAPMNDAPTFTSAPNAAAKEGQSFGYTITAEDVDGDELTITISGQVPDWLKLTNNGSDEGVDTATLSGTPGMDAAGSHFFPLTVSDGQESVTQEFTIVVENTDIPPEAGADSYSVSKGAVLTVDANGVLANDSDADGDALSAVLESGAGNGSVELSSDGSFVYTPNPGFSGEDSFSYRARAGEANSAVATVTISVVNTPPTATADSYKVSKGAVLTVDANGVLANDGDADGDALSAVLESGAGSGSVELSSNGSFVYTPNSGFSGEDSFSYRASDGDADSAAVTVTISVVNTPPTATADSYNVPKGTTLTVDANGVLANDGDADGDVLSAVLESGAGNGSVELSSDGSFVYTPNPGFSGEDSFSYRASDGEANSAVVTVTVSVVNTPPTATADSYSVSKGTVLTVDANGVLANDSDADGDTLSAVLDSGAGNGSVELSSDGSFVYTPNPGFSGEDSFSYKVSDGTASASATVNLDVTPPPPPTPPEVNIPPSPLPSPESTGGD